MLEHFKLGPKAKQEKRRSIKQGLSEIKFLNSANYKNLKGNTVHPRLSEQVELKFLLGRWDTQKIRMIEEEHFTY